MAVGILTAAPEFTKQIYDDVTEKMFGHPSPMRAEEAPEGLILHSAGLGVGAGWRGPRRALLGLAGAPDREGRVEPRLHAVDVVPDRPTPRLRALEQDLDLVEVAADQREPRPEGVEPQRVALEPERGAFGLEPARFRIEAELGTGDGTCEQ